MVRCFFKLLLMLMFLIQPFCVAHAEDFELAGLFQKRGVEGTIVISSFDGKNEYIHNINRAKQEFLPASTFKIPNTLIALDEGAISNEKEIIKWDGQDKGWSAWNKDQSLETAFPISCVWFYQELASRVGNEKYLSHLKKINYGNQKTGPEVKSFWLDGDLKVSAFDQIRFLKKLYSGNLPYKKQHLEILKKILVVEDNYQYTIRAKTGWATRINSQHGWYVGYVETSQRAWFFATNLQINKKSDSKYRKEITMEALKLKGII